MLKFLKGAIKKVVSNTGYKISKISHQGLQNNNPFLAAKNCITTTNPVIFDVGMNHGQTIYKVKSVYPEALIHGFEPSAHCFKDLIQKFKDSNIVLNNMGVSDAIGVLELNEYSWDALNSFLKRAYGTAQIVSTYEVAVTTIDDYVEKNNIDFIHILKSDTEGFELKVLKGAETLFNQNKIQFVYLELFFDVNFIGQSSVGDIFRYLEKKNFSLVRLYDITLTQDGLASKTDALFINKNFIN